MGIGDYLFIVLKTNNIWNTQNIHFLSEFLAFIPEINYFKNIFL